MFGINVRCVGLTSLEIPEKWYKGYSYEPQEEIEWYTCF
jgi:hypothetical protein